MLASLLNIDAQSQVDVNDAIDKAIRLASNDVLARVQLAVMLFHIELNIYAIKPIKHCAAAIAYRAIARSADLDLQALDAETAQRVKAESKSEIDALKKQVKQAQVAAEFKSQAIATIIADRAEDPAKSTPKPKPAREPKTTPAQATSGIAKALQASINLGFALGQRVTVKPTAALAMTHEKWRGKTGTITAKLGDRAWDLTFLGAKGGIASFDATELQPAKGQP